MIKQPLNPEGLQELLSSLYQLPDEQLQQEAASIAADFRLWIASHFIMENDQIDYLNTIDNRFIVTAATETRYFVANRLPITFIKTEKPVFRSTDGEGKLIDLDKKKENSFSDVNGFSEEESLTFTISYS